MLSNLLEIVQGDLKSMKTKTKTTSHGRLIKSALAVAIVASATSSQALTIRHDSGVLRYENWGKDSRFDGSCIISQGRNKDAGIASATCIHRKFVVLARHTLRNAENHMTRTGDFTEIRPRNAESGLVRHQRNRRAVRVDRIIYHDSDFSRFRQTRDIAIAGSRSLIQPLRQAALHTRWDESGKVCQSASGANNRNDGLDRSRKADNRRDSRSRNPDTVRWAGTNRIDRLQGDRSQVLNYDFDSSRRNDPNRLGSTTPFNNENGTAGGDSGSPVYIVNGRTTNSVAGVLSGGSGRTYGMIASYVRVRFYRNWIVDQIRRSNF